MAKNEKSSNLAVAVTTDSVTDSLGALKQSLRLLKPSQKLNTRQGVMEK